MTVERTIVRRILLILGTFLFLLGCVAREETAGWVAYHNQRYNFSFQHPPSWIVSEGPVYVQRYVRGVASLNNLGSKEFWLTGQRTSPTTSGFNSWIALNQLAPGAVYFQVGLWGRPIRPEMYGPEVEANDISQVLQDGQWELEVNGQLHRYSLHFFKWGRLWLISAYLVEPVRETDRANIEGVLDSFRFDQTPVAEEDWAVEAITSQVEFWANRERLPFHPATSEAAVGLYRVTTVRDGVDILVIVSYTWHQDGRFCRPLGCRRWIYRALANGDVWPERESGDYPFWLLRGKALRRMPDHRFLF